MTCIVGLVDRQRVYLGADSAATNNPGQQTIRVDQKIFRAGDFLFGCTSSYRMIQLLRYQLILPPYTSDACDSDEEDQLFRYLATDFIDAVRTCLKDGGYAKKEEERESGGNFLLACYGQLFCVENDYQVEEVVIGYNAIGSADDVALGALYATHQLELPPERRVRMALEAAAYHYADVRPPFVIESIEQNNSLRQ